MKRLAHILYALGALVLGSSEGWGADLQKGFEAAQRGEYAIALGEWKALAEQGNVEAQIYLGVIYANGMSYGWMGDFVFDSFVPRDNAEAAKWFGLAAEQGNVYARFYLDAVSTFDRTHRLAKQGNSMAQLNLALMYATGRVISYVLCTLCNARMVLQDYAEAADWYRRAAEQGNLPAQFNLAMMYHTGQGVRRDHAEAVMWFRRAAELGNADAQFNLGLVYANGDGVPRDRAEAGNWFRLSAAQGNTNAWALLGTLKLFGSTFPHPYIPAHTRTLAPHIPGRG